MEKAISKSKKWTGRFFQVVGEKFVEIILGALLGSLGVFYITIVDNLEQYMDASIAHAAVLGTIILVLGNLYVLLFLKKKKYRLIALITGIILSLMFVGVVIANIISHAKPNDKFTVAIAQIDDAANRNLYTQENIIQQLKPYNDEIQVVSINKAITTDAEAEKEAKKKKVDMILWGKYALQGNIREQAFVHITLFDSASVSAELLPAAKGDVLSRDLKQNDGFVLQTDLKKNAAYVSLIVVGLAKYHKNDLLGAEKTFELARREAPTNNAFIKQGTLYSYLGEIKDKQQNYKQAIEYFSQAFKLNPSNLRNLYNRGASYYKNNDLELAKNDYNELIKQDPKYIDAYLNRGVIFNNQGEHELAISDFNTVLKLNPKDDLAYYNRGGDYAALGKYNEALSDYTMAIKLNPERPNNYTARAIAYREQGKTDLALADFTEALRHNPSPKLKANAYFLRGMIYENQNQLDKAFADYDNELAAMPNDAERYNIIAGKYFIYKKYDKALELLNKAIEINPNYATAYASRGSILFQKQEFEKAFADYNKAIEIDPNESSAYTQRGIYFLSIGKDKVAARSDFRKALQLIQKIHDEAENPIIKEALQAQMGTINKLLTSF